MKRLWILLVPLLVAPLVALSLLTWWLAGRVQDELLTARRNQHADILADLQRRCSEELGRMSDPLNRWGQDILAGTQSPTPLQADWYLIIDPLHLWRYPAALSGSAPTASTLPSVENSGILDKLSQALSYERSQASVSLAAEIYQEVVDNENAPAALKARALLGLARCHQKLSNPLSAAEAYRQVIAESPGLRDETGVNFGAEASAALVQLMVAQEQPWVELWRSHVEALLEGRYPMSAVLALGHLTDALATGPADSSDPADREKRSQLERRIREIRQMDAAAADLATEPNDPGPHFKAVPHGVLLIQPLETESGRGWAVAKFDSQHMHRLLTELIGEMIEPARGLLGIRDDQGRTIVGTPVEPQALTAQASMSKWGLPWTLEIGVADLDAMQRQGRQRHLLLTGSIAALLLLIASGIMLGWHLMRREIELSRLKSDFVDNVSHELRTPVTSIKMFSEMLQAGHITDSARQQEYFRLLASESNRLARMIDNILNFSRIMAGRTRLSRRPVDMGTFLLELQEILEVQARTTGHQLHLHLGRDLPVCSIDSEAISRALANLVSNATKYSDKEKGITLTAQRRDGYLSIMVRDRGVGIPEQDLPHVFERFYRASSPNGDHVQGTGLGLTIVKDTIERHGGSVRIDSRLGEGTVVEMLLPAE